MGFKNDYQALPYIANYISGFVTLDATNLESEKTQQLVNLVNYYTAKPGVETFNHSLSARRTISFEEQHPQQPQQQISNRGTTQQLSFLKSNTKQHLLFASLDKESKKKMLLELSSYVGYFNNMKVTADFLAHQIKNQNIWIPSMRVSLDGPFSKAVGQDEKYYSKPDEIFCPSTDGIFGGISFYPKLLGNTKFPGLIYHSAVEKNNTIYIMGGLRSNFEYTELINDLSQFHVDGAAGLPPPLDNDVISNPNMIGNTKIYVFNTITNSLKEYTPRGDFPSPLLCCTGSVIGERYIFYYGGMEIITETTTPNNAKGNKNDLFLKKRLWVNNTGYILDTITMSFTKMELIARPNKYVPYPTTVPRFGQSQVVVSKSINNKDTFSISSTNVTDQDNNNAGNNGVKNTAESGLEKEKTPSPFSTQLMVLISGGYRQLADSKYEAMSDLWSVEIPVVERGKENYLKFGETALATMHKDSLNASIRWPSPRGFHAACVVRKSGFESVSLKDQVLSNLRKDLTVHSKFLNESNQNGYFNKYTKSSMDDPGVQPVDSQRENSLSNTLFARKQFLSNFSMNNLLCNEESDTSICSSATSLNVFASNEEIQPLTVDNSILVIHGGTNETGEILGDFWCFDLSEETWDSKTLKATSEKASSVIKKVDINVANHAMISVGEYVLLFGGLKSEINNYRTTNHSTITVVHLPGMNVVNAKQIDEPECSKTEFSLEAPTVRSSNGTFFMTGGIFNHRMSKEFLDRSTALAANTVETEHTVTQKSLHGAILGILAPTVSIPKYFT